MTIYDMSRGPMTQLKDLFGHSATLYHVTSSGYDTSGNAYNNKTGVAVTVILEPVTDAYQGDNIVGRHDLGDFICYFTDEVVIADGDYLYVNSRYYAVFGLKQADVGEGVVYQECSLKKVEDTPL